MEDFLIENDDKIKIEKLYEMIPSISKKSIELRNYQEIFQPVKEEIKLLYNNSSFPSKEKKENYKQMMMTFNFLFEDYHKSFYEWNEKMDEILSKYDYIKLKNFLRENPLDSIGTRTTKSFSFNVKKMADLYGIVIIQSLYSAKPEMTNNYPKKWLLKVYKQIDEDTNHEI